MEINLWNIAIYKYWDLHAGVWTPVWLDDDDDDDDDDKVADDDGKDDETRTWLNMAAPNERPQPFIIFHFRTINMRMMLLKFAIMTEMVLFYVDFVFNALYLEIDKKGEITSKCTKFSENLRNGEQIQ